jgi:hypothetical protein
MKEETSPIRKFDGPTVTCGLARDTQLKLPKTDLGPSRTDIGPPTMFRMATLPASRGDGRQ